MFIDKEKKATKAYKATRKHAHFYLNQLEHYKIQNYIIHFWSSVLCYLITPQTLYNQKGRTKRERDKRPHQGPAD